MKTRSFSREERKVMILTWFAIRIQNGNESYASMNEIARGLNMKPSSHLTKILFDMNNENKIAIRGVSRPGRWFGNEFMLMPGTYEAPKRRAIPVKVRGADAGQLELFK